MGNVPLTLISPRAHEYVKDKQRTYTHLFAYHQHVILNVMHFIVMNDYAQI